MTYLEPFILITILLILLYKWTILTFNVLKERGVPHFKPKPLLGNMCFDMIMGETSFFKYLIDLHTKDFKDSKVYGMYFMRDPGIIIRDVELLKKILVKDFQYFTNHKPSYEMTDVEIRRNLFFLKNQEWKDMRNILTPTFTSSKMRPMFELMNECCNEGIKYLNGRLSESGQQGLEIEMEDIFSRFTNDCIASAALGIKVVSFRQKENCFFTIGSTVLNFRGFSMLKAIVVDMFPKTMKFLGIRAFNGEKLQYFNRLVLSTMKYREQHHIVRSDLIYLLTEARKYQKSELSTQGAGKIALSDNDILAQCLLFFFAGFSKVATCLCFTAHELMENPAIQDRLYQEIFAVQQKLDGAPLDFDTLQNEMKYMDMIILESMRKWPPTVATDRVCSQDYDLTDADGNLVVKLRKNDDIWIPILGLHRDPENFENPDKFDPERFSEQNRVNIKPFTYLPYGIGPRNCLGQRFALLESKMILYHIVLNYKIVPGARTPNNIFDAIHGFHSTPDGFWMKLLQRSN